MAVGFKVRSAQTGQVTVDVSTKLTKVLGTRTTTKSNSSFTHSAFTEGTPFFVILSSDSEVNDSSVAEIEVDGSRIKWTYPDGKVKLRSTFLYGIYT